MQLTDAEPNAFQIDTIDFAKNSPTPPATSIAIDPCTKLYFQECLIQPFDIKNIKLKYKKKKYTTIK